MNIRLLIVLVILSSLFGYLEWGGGNHSFLFEIEYQIIVSLLSQPKSVAHPFVIIPLLGQLILLVALFQKKPSRILIYLGILSLTLLLGIMFAIGIMSENFKILISTIPFIITSILSLRTIRKRKKS
ncbi:hypothetical protein [Ekhidna sp.]|uniref:hypothetical protein n=1 Tax=Ekhidna sp. TaxID=2608089 RepID=UPI0032972103